MTFDGLVTARATSILPFIHQIVLSNCQPIHFPEAVFSLGVMARSFDPKFLTQTAVGLPAIWDPLV